MGIGGGSSNRNNNSHQQRSRGISSTYPGFRIQQPSTTNHATAQQQQQQQQQQHRSSNNYCSFTSRSSATAGGIGSTNPNPYSSATNNTTPYVNSSSFTSSSANTSSSASAGVIRAPSRSFQSSQYQHHPTRTSSTTQQLPPGVRPYVSTGSATTNNNRAMPSTSSSSTSRSSSIMSAARSSVMSAARNSITGTMMSQVRSASTGGGSATASSSRAATTPTSSQTPSQNPSSQIPSAASTSNTIIQRPGAYTVTRSTDGMQSQVYRVTVPPGVTPGNEFTVHAGTRRVRVRCPVSSRPGHSLQITLPPEPITSSKQLRAAPLTRPLFRNTTKTNTNTKHTNNNDDASIYEFPGRSDVLSMEGNGGAVLMTEEVRKVNMNAASSGGTAQTFLVTIPPNIHPGMQFTVNANGQRFMVTCPRDAGPGKKVRIVPPPSGGGGGGEGGSGGQQDQNQHQTEPMAAPKTQVFEVVVPPGVRPNQPFTLMANGQRVLVTCPPNVVSGQKIRFQLPIQDTTGGNPNDPNSNNNNSLSKISLSYKDDAGSSGWCRTIRVTDMKFQWVRVDNNNTNTEKKSSGNEKIGVSDDDEDKKKKVNSFFDLIGGGSGHSSSNNTQEVLDVNPAREHQQDISELKAEVEATDMGAKAISDMEGFDFGKAAYVRKIQYMEGNDARMRTGTMTLIPAQDEDACVDSKLIDYNYHGTEQQKTLVSYTDIVNVQSKPLDEKIKWFRSSICEELYSPWENGHVKIVIRRHSLLLDSVDAVMALGREDMKKRWRFEFVGEPGIEAGGLTREWFQLVTEQIFDPDFGLWLSSNNNQMSMQINAASRTYNTYLVMRCRFDSDFAFVCHEKSKSHLIALEF